MSFSTEWKIGALILATFLAIVFLPVGTPRFDHAVLEALHLAKWYAAEHVLLCLVPAFFIAGAIAVFVSQASVMRYLGPQANRFVAYGVSSVSGVVLAVCSCTVLPLFAGIYRMGAGLGPATAFLYSGPAINVMAIILTSRVLGADLGIGRGVGAIVFSVVIGVTMEWIFRRDKTDHVTPPSALPEDQPSRSLFKNALFFFVMIAILVIATWAEPDPGSGPPGGLSATLFSVKWYVTAILGVAFGGILVHWFKIAWWKIALSVGLTVVFAFLFSDHPTIPFSVATLCLAVVTGTEKGETNQWFVSSWEFAKQILPLLLAGVLVAGLLLGRVGHEGLIPSTWISNAVGGNSVGANVFAALAGALMYFATLTEVPIVQGLLANGMGKGPALALLLAGPALSLPNMLVISTVLGVKKTLVFVGLVVTMATISGVVFGALVAP